MTSGVGQKEYERSIVISEPALGRGESHVNLVDGDGTAQPGKNKVDKGGDDMNQDLFVVPSHNF